MPLAETSIKTIKVYLKDSIHTIPSYVPFLYNLLSGHDISDNDLHLPQLL